MMKKFFETALNDQLKTMGEPCKIVDKINQTVTPEFMAVVTTKTGDLTVEIGSMTYNIDGHALIPESVGQDKIIGNRLVTKDEPLVRSLARTCSCFLEIGSNRISTPPMVTTSFGVSAQIFTFFPFTRIPLEESESLIVQLPSS